MVPDLPAQSNAIFVSGTTLPATSISDIAVVGSATLTVGGAVQTINRQMVSAVSNGIVVRSSTMSVSDLDRQTGNVVTVGGSTIVAFTSGSAVVIGPATLTIGGAAQTINGQFAGAGSIGLVVGSSTTHIASAIQTENSFPSGAVVTGSDGQLVTILQSDVFTIIGDGDSSTVRLESQLTLAGQTIGVPTSGVGIVDGTDNPFASTRASGATVSPTQIVGAVMIASGGQELTIVNSGSLL
ncbi:hypothetical protein B0A55_07516 [Friedmanniomyces simplex]|uniref:Uncharacterized protein n=1 Tax=Friedmanniomyces simplex TaxID=329884 RepID=A0A4U0Y2A5_9PEZI|nr:hypothetical protein B0A55_07516 [Friedmanniomyces simplex]